MTPLGPKASDAPLAKIRVVEDESGSFLTAVEVVVDGEAVARLPAFDVETHRNAQRLTEVRFALHGDWTEVERRALPQDDPRARASAEEVDAALERPSRG